MVYSDAQPGPSNISKYSYLPVLEIPQNPGYQQPVPIVLTDNILSTFKLLDAYQRHVISHGRHQAQPLPASDDPVAAKKTRKHEKELYKQLFKKLPGKLDTKKDQYLASLLDSAWRETKIVPFDDTIANDVFTIYDLPQPQQDPADEEKKKKKKRKRELEASTAPTPAAHLPTPGGPIPALRPLEDPHALPQRAHKRRKTDLPPAQQPTPQG